MKCLASVDGLDLMLQSSPLQPRVERPRPEAGGLSARDAGSSRGPKGAGEGLCPRDEGGVRPSSGPLGRWRTGPAA